MAFLDAVPGPSTTSTSPLHSTEFLPSPRPSAFMETLAAPYYDIPSPKLRRTIHHENSLDIFTTMSRPQSPLSGAEQDRPGGETLPDRDLRFLSGPLYRPHGKWDWLSGVTITDSRIRSVLSSRKTFFTCLKKGTAGTQNIDYISKCSSSHGYWDGFLSELALYKVQLKALQGDVVPTILGVYCESGRISMAMEPPHHSFWMEASQHMPNCLKQHCIQAVEKLHACGVYHGDLRLSNILIGADLKINIINFEMSRALVPNLSVGLASASAAELRMEMRKLKWQLDYDDAREEEDARYLGLSSTPDAVELDSSVGPDVWTFDWLPSCDTALGRFVMPGQTLEQFTTEVNHFVTLLDSRSSDCLSASPVRRSRSPSSTTNPHTPPCPASQADTCPNITHVQDPGFSSPNHSQKRKIDSDSSNTRPVKKLRFIRASDGAPNEDGADLSFPEPLSPLASVSPGVPESEDISSYPNTKARIVDANIQRCAELGLPHPEALNRYPQSHHWRKPNVLEYIRRHNLNVLRVTQLRKRYPEKNFKCPQLKRSQGNLKRVLEAVATKTSLTESPMIFSRLGKRKREYVVRDAMGVDYRRDKRQKTQGIPDPSTPIGSTTTGMNPWEGVLGSKRLPPHTVFRSPGEPEGETGGFTLPLTPPAQAMNHDRLWPTRNVPYDQEHHHPAVPTNTQPARCTPQPDICSTLAPTYTKILRRWIGVLFNPSFHQ